MYVAMKHAVESPMIVWSELPVGMVTSAMKPVIITVITMEFRGTLSFGWTLPMDAE